MITYTMGWNYPGDTEAVFAAGAFLFGCCAGYITAEVVVTVTGSVFTGGAFLVARGALLLAKVGKVKKFIDVLRRGVKWASAADGKPNAVARLFASWFDVQRYLMQDIRGGEKLLDKMTESDDWKETSAEVFKEISSLSKNPEFAGPMLRRMVGSVPGATEDDLVQGLSSWLTVYGSRGRNIGTDAVDDAGALLEAEEVGLALIRLHMNNRQVGDAGLRDLNRDLLGIDDATSKKVDRSGLPDNMIRKTLLKLRTIDDDGQAGLLKYVRSADSGDVDHWTALNHLVDDDDGGRLNVFLAAAKDFDAPEQLVGIKLLEAISKPPSHK